MNMDKELRARNRIDILCDENSFCEMFSDFYTVANDFPNYADKLRVAIRCSNEKEAVVCGTCTIMGQKCIIFVMESQFMMGVWDV